ncbi:hypothetical protein BaRGS_00012946 [Batillaria attramentaria]|uniref:PiggyBac transposable element-derived protein 4 C-terminal zinc-finger domain-containing protein n=1 Tax=Batillaria attramentaria TaxID=370345 RepID=A0ABD0L8X9_9CAEN
MQAVRKTGRHYAKFIAPTEKRLHPTRNCRVCTIPAKRKPGEKKMYLHRAETRFECRACGGIALCIEPCFELYHEFEDYKRKIKTFLNLHNRDAES